METKKFHDITLSRLGMGNMRLPTVGGAPMGKVDYKAAKEIIDYGMSHGINYYDTAYVYHGGDSERFLGEAMADYPRESYHLATKFFGLANPDFKAVFEEQLSRLKTDYIDFYLLHNVSDPTFSLYLESGAIDYFLEQQKEGRIRYLGFSSHADLEKLRAFADHHKWDFAQIQLNYFDWKVSDTKQQYEILTERGIPVMVMEPVRGGRLASLTPELDATLKAVHPDWSPASWALRWVRTLPNVQVILSGMSNLDQIKDNVATFNDSAVLSEADADLLMEVAEKYHKYLVVPCTSCRYCCDTCPSEIDIPEFLKVYNRLKVDGAWGIAQAIGAVSSKGKPADCIACGACTSHCPQNIDVPSIMKELAAVK